MDLAIFSTGDQVKGGEDDIGSVLVFNEQRNSQVSSSTCTCMRLPPSKILDPPLYTP